MSLKSNDIPVELRTWWKSFEKASYRHDYGRVFDDFVTMTLSQFCPKPQMDDWHADAMKAYNREEKDAFNEMFAEIFRVFDQAIEPKGERRYFDMFGTVY